jgi:tetratricopeptide (TPR) repeat protein
MPPTQDTVDELFDVRNSFYLGHFQQCINEAQRIKSRNADVQGTAKVFMYRAYIAQRKYAVVLDEISDGAAPELCAVRLLAEYMSSSSNRDSVVKELKTRLSSGTETNDTLLLIAAYIYVHEEDCEEALRVLHGSDDLECMALSIQCLLKMDRPDLAVDELNKMQKMNEDATITNLATAWVNMAVGKGKLQDAYYIFQEMIDKYSATSLLLNAQAACLVMQQKYEQAESLLHEAMEKDNNNPETLANLIVVSQSVGKPIETSNRYISQLKDGHADHPWTKDYLEKDAEFDRLCRHHEATR